MSARLTIELDDELAAALHREGERSGKMPEEIVLTALRRRLRLTEFKQAREAIVPYAQAAGWRTDEDVFREVS